MPLNGAVQSDFGRNSMYSPCLDGAEQQFSGGGVQALSEVRAVQSVSGRSYEVCLWTKQYSRNREYAQNREWTADTAATAPLYLEWGRQEILPNPVS